MIIKKLDSKKASGMDNIKRKLPKACGSELSEGLAYIANVRVNMGQIWVKD